MTLQLVIDEGGYSTADRIGVLLFMRKMSQAALARALGFSPAGVTRRMHGDTWSLAETRRVAEILDSTVAFIAGETDDPTRPGVLKSEGAVNARTPAADATGVSDEWRAPRDSNPRPSDP
jgi:transcriptional regulator with XRE-family HTH domain